MENQISREKILSYLQNALPPVRQIEDCLIKKNELQNQANQNANTIESNKSLTLVDSILSAIAISVAVLACSIVCFLVPYIVFGIISLFTDVVYWKTLTVISIILSCLVYFGLYNSKRKNKTRGEIEKSVIALAIFALFLICMCFDITSSSRIASLFEAIAFIVYFPLPIVYAIYLHISLKKQNTKLSDYNEQLSQEIAALDNQSKQIYSQNIELIGDIPDNYCNVYSLEHLYDIVNNRRADNLMDAINIFEQDEHNRQMQEIAAQNAEALREAQMRIDMLENEVGRLNSEVASAQGRARRAESKARQAKSDANFSMWYNAMK
ncbi:MAG: hypothetical protein LUH57_05110 [Ruminococcus sp.]|nr:hypothetical protein [Ruminococcus sp.]